MQLRIMFQDMHFGRERRLAILKRVQHYGMAVNRKHCVQTSDINIKRLLKTGMLRRTRQYLYAKHATTILNITDKGRDELSRLEKLLK